MKKLIAVLISLLLFALTAIDADAQRRSANTYETLLQRSEQPSSYIDHVVLPQGDDSYKVAVFFRLDYDFLPFLRKRANMNAPSSEYEYFAPVRMGLEVFEGRAPESRRSRQSPRSLFRDSWSDTVWVETFEQTQSKFDHVQGHISRDLSKGNYHYNLQLGRGESTREVSSRPRNLILPEFSEADQGQIMIASTVYEQDNRFSFTMMNYGSSVLYGQDYELVILLPNEEKIDAENFSLNIYRMRSSGGSEPESSPMFTKEAGSDQIFRALPDSFTGDRSSGTTANLNKSDDGFRYLHFSIPNAEFENTRFKVELKAEGRDKPVAERVINSQWIDMPVSLYNLDVAIEMLKFIVSDRELRRINSGSSSERERKFREFWAERDPTPDTEFNELMDEYYKRIDFAYRNFSSLQTPGFETDQGRAYIIYGPPLNIDRRLERNRPTREIWEYPNRTLIFEATTGFGDFRLVSDS